MIGSLRGELIHREPNEVILDVAGVGFRRLIDLSGRLGLRRGWLLRVRALGFVLQIAKGILLVVTD